jgi:hypothetical protein
MLPFTFSCIAHILLHSPSLFFTFLVCLTFVTHVIPRLVLVAHNISTIVLVNPLHSMVVQSVLPRRSLSVLNHSVT